MIDIREIIKRPEYKWIEEYKDRLMFLTFGGSHAYGTNLPTSDIDIRGVMLPTKESLIGLNKEEQRLDPETDTCIYEFNKFVKLISNCNPNTIELIGCKPEQVLIFNDLGKELIDNKDLFISQKCINSFSGYAISQLRRLQNANCHDSYNKEEKERHILATLENVKIRNLDNNQRLAGLINLEIIDNEINIRVKEGSYKIRELATALNELSGIARGYDKLNYRNSKKDEIHLSKHAMHLTRLYLMCLDIIEGKGINTYRENDLPLLLSIRKGEWLREDGQMQDRFFDLVTELEQKLEKAKKTMTINKNPNYKKIEEFVIKINSLVIKEDYRQYNQPKLLSEF